MYSLLRRGVLLPLLTGVVCVGAERFNLEVQNLTLEEARSSPAGYGGFGQFTTAKPATVAKVPSFQSKHPLYGQVYSGAPGRVGEMVFVLDEPKGDGKGYGELRVDLNRNGDLTDDGVLAPHEDGRTGMPAGYEQATFGPVVLPEDQVVGQWRPRFYVEVYLYNKEMLTQMGGNANFPIGQLRLLPASWLVTTVDVNGVKQRFGLADGNCDFHLPDGAQVSQIYRSSSSGPSWYLSPGDWFLRDLDNNGTFESRPGQEDAEMVSSLIYFGARPFLVTVEPSLAWVEFAPYAGPTGRLKVQGAVSDLVLGWQPSGGGGYEALAPGVVEGEAIVPAGEYRAVSCALSARATGAAWVMATSSEVPDKPFTVKADEVSTLELGLPLEIIAEATERTAMDSEPGFKAAVSRLFGGGRSSSAVKDLVINATIRGAGGERYSSFLELGGRDALPSPRFEVRDPQAKVVASGNLEFG